MKIQIASDLHIEFDRHQSHQYTIDYSKADILVFAGDVDTKEQGLRWIQQNIKDIPVIYVLGNHEFYGEKYPTLIDKLKESAKGSNIHILENDMVTIDGINFLGCTLWANFNLIVDPCRICSPITTVKAICERRINDYRKINIEKGIGEESRIRADDTAKIHQRSVSWLKKTLKKIKGETNIVVTHHAPSVQSVKGHYEGNITSSAYASDLEQVILEYNPTYWIHGHIHYSSNYTIGQTKVISNPRGYYNLRLNTVFTEEFIIDV